MREAQEEGKPGARCPKVEKMEGLELPAGSDLGGRLGRRENQ